MSHLVRSSALVFPAVVALASESEFPPWHSEKGLFSVQMKTWVDLWFQGLDLHDGFAFTMITATQVETPGGA